MERGPGCAERERSMTWIVTPKTDIPPKIWRQFEAQEIAGVSVTATTAEDALSKALETCALGKKYGKYFSVEAQKGSE